MVYQFPGIEFDVSQDERIKSIYIDYLDVNEEKIFLQFFGILW